MDRLTACVIAVPALAVAACTRGGSGPPVVPHHTSQLPRALQNVRPPPRLDRVRVATVPASTGGPLGRCLRETLFRTGRVLVVERSGALTRSVTVLRRGNPQLYACDATGVRLEGREWCGVSAGILRGGRLLDPRLDILCVDRKRRHVASAWVDPVPGARWIGVDQGAFTELYPTAAGLPVRIASRRNVEYRRSRAAFLVRQYATGGRELAHARLTAQVAG